MSTGKKIIYTFCILLLLGISACLKDKKLKPSQPNELLPNSEEVITTFKLIFTDSVTQTQTLFLFKDPDGPGGESAYYGPSASIQTDSVIKLKANTIYFAEIILLDETKNPLDSISNQVKKEGLDHMFFYKTANTSILNSGNPYTIKLNDANISIIYKDLDEGTPQRGIGLDTRWQSGTSPGVKIPLNITLRHQPGVKDGTYAPGESDISVNFKLEIN